MTQPSIQLLLIACFFVHSHAVMIRNDALISKMVSDFQKDNTATGHNNNQQQQQHQQHQQERQQQQQQPKNVVSIMQNVLCRNFPSIPCDMIVEDTALNELIERSIQQIKFKKLLMVKTTPIPGHLKLFPQINIEDLSNFLQVRDTGYLRKNNAEKQINRRYIKKSIKSNAEEQTMDKEPIRKRKKKESLRTTLYGRKKIRKFYPHKIKYKDKFKGRKDVDYSDEKMSMSVELPDMKVGGLSNKREKMNFKVDPEDPPVWRIDYMKHGEPSLNEKLVKAGPNVIVSDNVLEKAARKDVLHPDVYIKKNFMRKGEMSSDDID